MIIVSEHRDSVVGAEPAEENMSVTRRAAVLGSPVAHSLSPVLHRAAYTALGLDWRYDAIECDAPGLPGLLGTLDGTWAGLSLTMPLKKAVLPLLDRTSPLCAAIGAANTVVFEEGGRSGFNTDVHGIVAALAEAGVTAPGSTVVLGGGATAASALAALYELGRTEAAVVVRDPVRAADVQAAADRLGVTARIRMLGDLGKVIRGADLVMSTLPAGAADAYAPLIAESGAVLFDVVYAPWPTPAARRVTEAGGVVVGGLSMLLHQAVRQVALMTGRPDVPVAAMRGAVEAELGARHAR